MLLTLHLSTWSLPHSFCSEVNCETPPTSEMEHRPFLPALETPPFALNLPFGIISMCSYFCPLKNGILLILGPSSLSPQFPLPFKAKLNITVHTFL